MTNPEQFEAELATLANVRLTAEIQVNALTVYQLILAVQLALRHPDFTEAIAHDLKSFCLKIEATLPLEPHMKQVLKEGW